MSHLYREFPMPIAPTPSNPAIVTPQMAPSTVWLRLGWGLAQSALLYFLYLSEKSELWPATQPLLFAPLLLSCVIAPVLAISGIGSMKPKTLGLWLVCAVLICVGLGFYGVWRGLGAYHRDISSAAFTLILLAAGFFLAHAMVLSSAADRRPIATYPTYFDISWKLLVQIKFALLFVGVCWIVFLLGANLFKLVGLQFLYESLQEAWFAIPMSVISFACALHLTDVRPAIVQGIRNLLLVLLSWLLPVTVLIVGGFLATLPFTGLSLLWATKHATLLLLSASLMLVVLVNSAFQNGLIDAEVPRILRFSARAACLLLLPLVLISAYALSLRVGSYGWTTDRIIAASCLLVAGCYAVGYAYAAVRSAQWLNAIAPINISTALIVLALVLGLLSPLLDPARISVANQVARLESGRQPAATFDFDYLRFKGSRYGMAALERLKAFSTGPDAQLIQERAALAIAKTNPWMREEDSPPTESDLRSNLTVWPKGQQIPAWFVAPEWAADRKSWTLPECLRRKNKACDAHLIDFDGDGKTELLLIQQDHTYIPSVPVFSQGTDSQWKAVASLPGEIATCPALQERLRKNDFKLVPPKMRELEIAGQRIPLNEGEADPFKCSR